jgi:phosphoserine phosphatase
MRTQSNVSIPYVQNRVRFLAGLRLDGLRRMGERCFAELYPGKIFEPMRRLVQVLQAEGFEVWIVSASPEALYQGFLSRELGIPITRVIGVKSVVRGGVVTDQIVPPVPQDAGKLEAIETFVQDTPLLVAGNSRGDREMILHARLLHLIVNPDEHVEAGEAESIAGFAARQGWVVVRVPDLPDPARPAISGREYGIRENKSQPGPP